MTPALALARSAGVSVRSAERRHIENCWGGAAKFTGDVRTHLMAIDPDSLASLSADGKTANSQIGLDFACKHCHVQGGKASVQTDEQLRSLARNYHLAK
jgi:hypothetical protein